MPSVVLSSARPSGVLACRAAFVLANSDLRFSTSDCNCTTIALYALSIQYWHVKGSASPGNDDEVSTICFPHKLNIVLEGW